MWLVAVSLKQFAKFFLWDACQKTGISDLISIKMQNRQYAAVSRGIEKLVPMPARGEGASLCFAVPDDTGDDQVGIIKRRTERVRQRVAEFSPFMD